MSTRPAPPVSVAVRVTTVCAVGVVALVAAVVSYAHMQVVAERAGEHWRSWLVPLSVDGLVVAASMVLLTRRRAGLPGGWLPWSALLAGVGASLAANMTAAEPTVTARLVAAWPAVAFAVAFELLLQQRRPAPDPPAAASRETSAQVTAQVTHSTLPADLRESPSDSPRTGPVRPLVPLVPPAHHQLGRNGSSPLAPGRPADPPGVRPDVVPAVGSPGSVSGDPGPPGRGEVAGRGGLPGKQPTRPKTDTQLIAQIRRMAQHNGGRLPSVYAARQALGVGGPRAERLLAELGATTSSRREATS